MGVEFIETSFFTRRITDVLSDDEYADLQAFLRENPEAGDLIPAGGGLRKIRWKASGHGKRGSVRIIYYCRTKEKLIMLYAYHKTEQEDLTSSQLKALREFVKGGAL